MVTTTTEARSAERAFTYRVLRYTPNPVRDEWVNIGVLVFDEQTGERRLRMIEEPEEYARVRRLHPRADESLLRLLRNNLEDRLAASQLPGEGAGELAGGNGHAHREGNGRTDWLKLLGKWDQTLSNVLQLAQQKGVHASDLDAETERLYGDHVAPERGATRVGAPGSRGVIRSYCAQVLRQARLWERLQKGLRAEEFTFPGDPMRIDYGYRRNGTRGFVQTLSVTPRPGGREVPGVYRGAHPEQGEGQRIHGGDGRESARGKRAASLRAGDLARRGRGGGGDGRVRGVDGEDAAVDPVRESRYHILEIGNRRSGSNCIAVRDL